MLKKLIFFFFLLGGTSFGQYSLNWDVFIIIEGDLANNIYNLSGISFPIEGRSSNSTYTAMAGVSPALSSIQQATLTLQAQAISPVCLRLTWDDIATETSYTLYRNGFFLVNLSANTIFYEDTDNLKANTEYTYLLEAYAGTSIIASGTTTIKTPPSKHKFIPYHNLFYPNKGERVSIYYEIFSSCEVSIKLYDLKGRLIKNLVSENKSSGKYWTEWDGKDDDGELADSGVYIIQIKAGSLMEAKKIILVR
ncbi:MAG: FlgD immunoglobulin-like domain containing protein [bacterium]